MRNFITTMAALAMAALACQDEGTPPPPEPQPEREDTVTVLVSDAWDPDYSPDGASLVYAEAYHLAVIDLHTMQRRNLTPNYARLENCPTAPAWLPGDVVAYVRKDETTHLHNIYTIPAGGGTITKYDAEPDPDGTLGNDATGRYVYYTDRTDQLLYRLDLQTGGRQRLTSQHMVGFAHFDPRLKPGGAQLYFEERAYPFDPNPHMEYINRVNVVGGVPVMVFTADNPFLKGMDASPDGKYLVYPHRLGLFALEINTGAETWLTRSPDTWEAKDARPSWSPDNNHIAFTRDNDVCVCDAP